MYPSRLLVNLLVFFLVIAYGAFFAVTHPDVDLLPLGLVKPRGMQPVPSVSLPISQEVLNPIATTTTLAAAGNSVFGQSVTLTATVKVNAPGTGSLLGGTVAFKNGTSTLGTGILSPTGTNTYVATYTTSATQLAAGSHSISASFVAFANFTASTSAARTQTVAAASTQTKVVSSATYGDMFGEASHSPRPSRRSAPMPRHQTAGLSASMTAPPCPRTSSASSRWAPAPPPM